MIFNNKKLSIILILIFISLIILGKLDYLYWFIDGLLVIALCGISSIMKHKDNLQKAQLPENMNYHKIFINISRHDEKILGEKYQPITYMYINTSSKVASFPESKYYLNRKYHLINVRMLKHSTSLLTLSIIDHSKSNISIKITDLQNDDVKLLKQLLK